MIQHQCRPRRTKPVTIERAVNEYLADASPHEERERAEASAVCGPCLPTICLQRPERSNPSEDALARIRLRSIAAIEGRAHVHSDYALLASVIVAGDGATFQDVAHFSAGVAPGDEIFTTWSYRAGAGRAEAFLLNPQPITARTAYEWGVVAEVAPNGKALSRARELAELYLKAPEVTRRNTRIHFIQPLKERIVREVGYGLSLEGASAADLVKSMRAKNEPVAQKGKVA